jgi:F0F1-type ATP synthase delta subunit
MDIKLPLNIIDQIDINRILRELKAVDDFFVAAKARPAGSNLQMPKLTRSLEEIAKANNYNLLEEEHRKNLYTQIQQVKKNAPLVHISFAAEPSPSALERILVWFRANIHPQLLLQVGLQPTIAAGCVVRTNNKVFDMSLREHLNQEQKYLIQLIDVATKKQ